MPDFNPEDWKIARKTAAEIVDCVDKAIPTHSHDAKSMCNSLTTIIISAIQTATISHEQAWVKVLHKIAKEYADDMVAARMELDAERERHEIEQTAAYAKGAQHQHREDELVRKPLVDALKDARSAISSLSDDALGMARNDKAQWPIKMELLEKIDKAIADAKTDRA